MRGFALDMDGTIYHGEQPIPGAREFVGWLRDNGVPFRFLTNNSSHGRRFYADRLNRMGFDVTVDDILSSTTASARYIVSRYPGKKVFALGVPDMLRELEEAGVVLDEDDPDIVLLGFDTTITYDKINRAYQLLKRGKTFIATHPDDLCPTEDGYDIDIGPFIRMFSQMCQTEPLVIGKPSRRMLEMAALEMGIDAEDVIMVGDRAYTDIRMAVDAGTDSIAVLSGETTREELKASGIEPTYICDSVADIPGLGIQLG